jgi:DNA-binding response OmpR family regulator
MLRPLRDQILRISGFDVDSTLSHAEGLSLFWGRPCDLILIEIEGESGISYAEQMCSEIKTAQPGQLVALSATGASPSSRTARMRLCGLSLTRLPLLKACIGS